MGRNVSRPLQSKRAILGGQFGDLTLSAAPSRVAQNNAR
jgi:hypothetical protein